MAKTNKTKPENDSTYFLKLLLYVFLGSLWLKVSRSGHLTIPMPVGLVIGLLLTRHEHFQIDRKIELAILLVVAVLAFWLPYGLYVNL